MHCKILDVNMRSMAQLALCVLGWNKGLPPVVHICLCSSSCLPARPIKASKVLTCTDSAPLQLAWLGNFWGEWMCICSAHLPVIHVIGWGGIFCWTIPSLSCAALSSWWGRRWWKGGPLVDLLLPIFPLPGRPHKARASPRLVHGLGVSYVTLGQTSPPWSVSSQPICLLPTPLGVPTKRLVSVSNYIITCQDTNAG